ncbi:hypothetical protein [Helicobacter bilis]|uniref:hypothetical protein n=1 Tax=Helicobacter bilis TaxID=37372 RepID=UPI0026EE16EA|nr:hypothetical protein [Helicobacter bilis]
MSLSSYILNALSLRQKIVVILLFSSVMLGIVSVCIMRSEWIFSLLCGCLSYILLMIVTFQSIRTKITQKIQEADTEEKLLKYASKYDDEMQDITQKVISQDSKHNAESYPNEWAVGFRAQNSKILESQPFGRVQGVGVQDNENLESTQNTPTHTAQNLEFNNCHINQSEREISSKSLKQNLDSIPYEQSAELKTQDKQNLDSKPCHIERSEISNMKNIESKLSKDSINKDSSIPPNTQTTENTESNPTAKQSKKEKSKERLKLLDLSKASLGFELSFSLPRIFVFIGMIVCCVVLVWFRAFYPLVYLFGVFLGVVLIMCFLLMKRWHDDFMQNSHKHDTKSCKTC